MGARREPSTSSSAAAAEEEGEEETVECPAAAPRDAKPEPDETEDAASKRPTLGIFPNHIQQGPTYLIFSSKAEKEK